MLAVLFLSVFSVVILLSGSGSCGVEIRLRAGTQAQDVFLMTVDGNAHADEGQQEPREPRCKDQCGKKDPDRRADRPK